MIDCNNVNVSERIDYLYRKFEEFRSHTNLDPKYTVLICVDYDCDPNGDYYRVYISDNTHKTMVYIDVVRFSEAQIRDIFKTTIEFISNGD
jgi:hypothetical protein